MGAAEVTPPETGTARLVFEADGACRVEGPLTYATVPALAREHPSHPATSIALDGVTHADSAGLALLLEWLRTAGEAGESLTFHDLPEQFISIAQVSNLADLLPTADQG